LLKHIRDLCGCVGTWPQTYQPRFRCSGAILLPKHLPRFWKVWMRSSEMTTPSLELHDRQRVPKGK